MVETASRIASPGAKQAERAFLVRDYLEGFVAFVPDPDQVELLKSPEYMLRTIAQEGQVRGDCDDVAVLGAALGRAVGLPARFTLLAFNSTGTFRHVFTELWTPCQGWVELDTTRPAQFPEGLRVSSVEHHGA